jgi:hypothetical protein
MSFVTFFVSKRMALENMPPLSLAMQNSKRTFLTPHVLNKVDDFFQNFLM